MIISSKNDKGVVSAVPKAGRRYGVGGHSITNSQSLDLYSIPVETDVMQRTVVKKVRSNAHINGDRLPFNHSALALTERLKEIS